MDLYQYAIRKGDREALERDADWCWALGTHHIVDETAAIIVYMTLTRINTE